MRTWSYVVLCLAGAPLAVSAPAASGPIEFNRDIRPLLSDKCFTCHGPDASKRMSKLRLDLEASVTSDLGGRRAIVPHHPEQSELVRRISAVEPGLRMPPTQSGRTLSDAEADLLKRWIAEGAPWQGHWAFVPPVRPA